MNLRDRTRQLAVQEILDTALRLFTEQGFEATTIAQVAHEAGVSQRTLFRYFGTKEDLVGGAQDEFVALVGTTLREQPDDVDAWTALREALAAALSVHATPLDALARFRLIHTTASLRAAYLGKRVRLQEKLVPLVEARLDGSVPAAGSATTRARAVLGTVFGCFDAAMATWLEHDGEGDLLDLYDEAVAAVRGARA